MNEAELKAAHDRSWKHRSEIENSTICGCFFCLATFVPGEINEWIDDQTTAMCPRCGIDSVIGNASGLPVSDQSFLDEMASHYFGGPVDLPVP